MHLNRYVVRYGIVSLKCGDASRHLISSFPVSSTLCFKTKRTKDYGSMIVF